MNEALYKGLESGGMILRDHLALDRTVLANERTLLAYVRTSIAFAGAGAALIHFFQDTLVQTFGWILLPVAALTIIAGFLRFHRLKRRLAAVKKHAESCQP